MRMLLSLFAVGAGAYILSQRTSDRGSSRRGALAPNQPWPVRDAGPAAMRDPPKSGWSSVDEASDQSFPASDPPSTY